MNRDALIVISNILRKDLLAFRREYIVKLLELAFLLFTNAIVFAYFMPEMGLGKSYGPFLVVGAISVFGFFDVFNNVGELAMDIEGDKTIFYNLTLPIQSGIILSYFAFRWALTTSMISIVLFPLGKLFVFNRWDLSQISFFQLILMFITIHIFYGAFSLWLTSMLKKLKNLGSLWYRIINPLFMFGAYFYSWKSLYSYSPTISWISLINPLVYVMEGMRAASLGQEGYLNFWVCFFVLWGFIIVCLYFAVRKLKKRLDCI